MEKNKATLSTGSYIGIMLLMIMFLAIYMQDIIISYVAEVTDELAIQESQKSSDQVASLLNSLNKIKFNTAVLKSDYIQNLTPFPDYPIDAQSIINFGKVNPFVGNIVVTPDKVAPATGGVIYSSQRVLNGGASATSTRRR